MTEEQTGSEWRDWPRVPEPAKGRSQSLPCSGQLPGHPVLPPGLGEQEDHSPSSPIPRPGVGARSVLAEPEPDCPLPLQPCSARRRPSPTTSALPAAPPPASPGRPAWTVRSPVWTAATAPMVCRGWGEPGSVFLGWHG